VINNDQLSLGDGGNMKLDMNPFLVGMVELMNKKILVRTDQAETTKGKNVVVWWFSQPNDQAPQPGGWRVEGEHAAKAI
jgi:hypothetical protein